MELSSYSQDGAISLYFLLPSQCEADDCSKLLKYAFQACKEHELSPVWLSHEDCLKLLPTKQDVFVCDPFEGEAFEYLLSGRFKCVVLGPRCLLTCLHSKKPVPELPPPLHNMAMHEMVITSTGFERNEKIYIQKLVEKMCGIYSNSFHEGITHLIAKAVGTKKYLVAMEKEIPVMTEEWVEAVWKLSNEESDENVSATHEQFVKYSCPVFRGLIICVSQMPRKEKEMMKGIIEKNGGTYSPNLEMHVTSLLITASADGEKYRHATQWRIPCVKQDWVHDSVECGFALPQDQYIIKKEPKASTPTSDFHASRVVGPPDVSICSTILHDSSTVNVNETRDQEFSMFLKKPSDSKVAAGVSALEEIDLQEVVKAGQFLDGCKVFASGFDSSLNEKLRRIFNLGGAIRLNNMSETVTHVVVGKHVDEHLNLIKDCPVKPYVVTGEWLMECIKNKKMVEEEKFLYMKPDIVMKTLSPLTPAPQTAQKDKEKEQGTQKDDHTYVDEELMNQYMTDKSSARKSVGDKSVDCSTLPDTQQSSYGGMYKGLTFTVSGYSEDIEEQLIELICENGGEVLDVKTSKPVKYCIVSLEGKGVFVPNAVNYITHLYMEDCFEQESLLPVEYYHMPFVWPSNFTILSDCVLATSTYKGKERGYISHIAASMGALCQDMFSKRSNSSKGIKASTHLLCPSPEGSKYAAAKKWGIPAVTKDWLLMCAQECCKVYETPYSVDQNPRIVNGRDIMLLLLKKAGKLSGDVDQTVTSLTHPKGFAVPLSRQLQNVRNQISNEEIQIQTPDPDTIRRMYPTPGAAPTSNDSIDEMPTPDTPYGSTWYKNPPPRVRKGLKRVLDSMPDDGSGKKKPYLSPTTPEEFYFKKHTENLKEIVANNPFPKPPNFNDDGFPSPHQDAGEKQSPEKGEAALEVEPALPADHHGPLTGVIVYASRKLADSQNELYEVVTELGGDYRWTYDKSVTHFLHYGRMNDTNKEFRIARDDGKFIVAPDWVWMCRDERKRIDESLFPHVHNPKMSLSLISTKISPVKNRKRGRKKKVEGMVMESQFEEDGDDNEGEDECRNPIIVDTNKEAAEKSRESLAKELEELENLAAVTIGGQRKSLNSNARNKTPRDADKLKNKPTRSPSTQLRPTGNTETESQNTAITWDDPQEREARARLEVALVGDTEDILAKRQVEEIYNEEKENSPKEANVSSCTAASVTIKESQTYIIALSGMSDEEKEKYTNIVKCLKGSIVDGKHFDPSVTHIISQKPSRSEKHLAAIASGKWILYRTFLDFSEEAGHFVEEEPHEWGNPSSRLIPSLSEESTEGKLAFAAHRWRIHFGEKGYGAFYSMKVMFFSSKDRVSAFTRLIEAGGGEVIKNLGNIDEVSHCFVELNKAPKTDLAVFASRKIPCLPPMYLNEFLINYPPPDEMESCIQEYKDIVNNMTFSDISRISRR